MIISIQAVISRLCEHLVVQKCQLGKRDKIPLDNGLLESRPSNWTPPHFGLIKRSLKGKGVCESGGRVNEQFGKLCIVCDIRSILRVNSCNVLFLTFTLF